MTHGSRNLVTAAAFTAATLVASVTALAAPATAMNAPAEHSGRSCFHPASVGAGARGGADLPPNPRGISRREQHRIEAKTRRILDRKASRGSAGSAAVANALNNIP